MPANRQTSFLGIRNTFVLENLFPESFCQNLYTIMACNKRYQKFMQYKVHVQATLPTGLILDQCSTSQSKVLNNHTATISLQSPPLVTAPWEWSEFSNLKDKFNAGTALHWIRRLGMGNWPSQWLQRSSYQIKGNIFSSRTPVRWNPWRPTVLEQKTSFYQHTYISRFSPVNYKKKSEKKPTNTLVMNSLRQWMITCMSQFRLIASQTKEPSD